MSKEGAQGKIDHFLLIPHGIRKYADKINCSYIDAYDATSIVFCKMVKWVMVDHDIDEFSFLALTLNAMQTRSYEELTPVIEIESTVYENPDFIEFLKKNDIRVRFYWNFSKLPKYYTRAMKNLERMTESCKKKRLNILIGYGLGKKSLFERIKKKLFRDLFTTNPPQLVVSTAGKSMDTFFESVPKTTKTLVVEKLFPELTEIDIDEYLKHTEA
ncbi:MAG TPA: undecaprenyl diphosphate synthase family protein [Candidatus Methanofastidiosa archaeon]|nr:undecaprenyl diphosphate synthase family protein [Candidatus Methanofastidiosa archaeon]